jgi:Na+/melibiose symporter-like transporter
VTFTDARFFKALIDLARDRVLVVFGVAMLFYFVANGTVNSLAVFSFGVGLQLPDKLFLVIFILYISSLCALPFMMRLARRAQKHQLLAGAFLLEAVVYGSHLLVPSGSFPTVAALWIVTGIANAAAIVLPTSMLADIVDHGEVTARERRPGAYMAIYNLIMKIGLALGVGLSFGLLDLVGYDPSATKYSATDAFNIRLLGFALPALLLGPAILLIWKHPITRKVQQQLRSQIEARDGAARND